MTASRPLLINMFCGLVREIRVVRTAFFAACSECPLTAEISGQVYTDWFWRFFGFCC
eukprot:COSAG02_NODE_8782_length_2448_cov_168.526181_1_plen_56_part_10